MRNKITDPDVTIPLSQLMEMLEDAARRGIESGEKGTAVEFTPAGIAMHVRFSHL